jgi:hypothetical protein
MPKIDGFPLRPLFASQRQQYSKEEEERMSLLDFCPRVSQPFGEYLVSVVGVPQLSAIAVLLRCCGTLFLFRSDPPLLQVLCQKWAMAMRARSVLSNLGSTSSGSSTPTTATIPTLLSAYAARNSAVFDDDSVAAPLVDEASSAGNQGIVQLSTPASVPQHLSSSSSDDDIITSFLSHLQLCVGAYFRWNWDHSARVMQANVEYCSYISQELIPIAVVLTRDDLETDGALTGCTTWDCSQAIRALAASSEQTSSPQLPQPSQTRPRSLSNGESYSIPAAVRFVGAAELNSLRRTCPSGVLVVFHAAYSEGSCRTVTILHDSVCKWRLSQSSPSKPPDDRSSGWATGFSGDATPEFVVVNGALEVQLCQRYEVRWYPTIIYFYPVLDRHCVPRESSDENVSTCSIVSDGAAGILKQPSHIVYPENGLVRNTCIAQWISSGGTYTQLKKIRNFVTRATLLDASLRFKSLRKLHSACVMLQKLQCIQCLDFPHTRDDPPIFYFLGGGMAAGKTTAVMALTKSDWWQRRGSSAVIVNADEFKQADPMFHNLKTSDLHVESTKSAEQLLVTALNHGRDIIFDGTMSWLEFVAQTVQMIHRATTMRFRCGRGYLPAEKVEEYWVEDGVKDPPMEAPYVIKVLAITVDPAEAVPRGIIRSLMEKRSVPAQAQLRSFQLFSSSFERYAEMCDDVVLLNNNVRVDLSSGELPPVIAQRRPGSSLEIIDAAAYEQFQRQRFIRDSARNADELYAAPSSLVASGDCS